MTFPDSTKKAPDIFLDVADDTGSPNGRISVATNGTLVFNLKSSRFPSPPTHVVAVIIAFPPGQPLNVISQAIS